MRYEILGLLVYTCTANYEYSRSNRENLPLQIQTKLSEKNSCFCGIFFQLLQSMLNFQYSEKNMSVKGQTFLKLTNRKDVLI